jgi:prefoldin alpha subunit
MAEKSSEEDLQSKYYEYQALAEQIKQAQQQMQVLEEQLQELNSAIEGLVQLQDSADAKTVLVPISPGIFAKAQLLDDDKLFVNVGSNIMVTKDIESTKVMTRERIDAVKAYQLEINSSLLTMVRSAKSLEKELQAMVSEIKG